MDKTVENMCNLGYGVLKYGLFFINFIVFLASAALTSFMIWALTLSEEPVESFFQFISCTFCLLCLVGSVFTFMTFFGWLGSLRDNTVALLVYRIVLAVVILAEVAVIIIIFLLVYVPDTTAILYPEQFSREAIEQYRDRESLKEFIDQIQMDWHCCGISNNKEGYKDWSANVYFNCSNPNVNFGDFCSVPFSCCKYTSGDYKNLLCGKGMAHPDVDATERETTIYTQGCFYALVERLKTEILIVGGIGIGILIPQIFLFGMAKTLTDKINYRKMKLAKANSFDRVARR